CPHGQVQRLGRRYAGFSHKDSHICLVLANSAAPHSRAACLASTSTNVWNDPSRVRKTRYRLPSRPAKPFIPNSVPVRFFSSIAPPPASGSPTHKLTCLGGWRAAEPRKAVMPPRSGAAPGPAASLPCQHLGDFGAGHKAGDSCIEIALRHLVVLRVVGGDA